MPRRDFTPGVDYVIEDHGYETPCHIWQGAKLPRGYGVLYNDNGSRYAHRVAYEQAHGPIPPGLVCDHLCNVKSCVNPDHIELKTNRANILRSDHPIYATHRSGICGKGHAMTEDNVYVLKNGQRRCRTCVCERQRRYEREKRVRKSLLLRL